MAKDRFDVDGVVIDILPGSKFKVELENGHICICTLSGKMRQNFIKVIRGDKVTIDLSTADPELKNGRIIFRNK